MTWAALDPAAPPHPAAVPPPPPEPARRGARPGWAAIAGTCACVVVVAVASALFVGTRGATQYGGRADILYDAPASASLDARERGMATQRGLVTSRAVLAPVSATEHVSRRRLENRVSVDIGARDDLMHITVADTDRNAAVRLAAAVAASYLTVADRLRPGTDAGPNGAAAASEPTPRLLSPAYALDSPLSPKPVRLVAAGLLVGLALAAATALAMARRTRPA